MDSLITVMNKLQDVFSTVGTSQKIDLPQIVVVGSQSSGKSSVLESLVGKSFLPRGTGIVTRAPLVLHLINSNDNDSETKNTQKSKEWATFLHKPNAVYYDFHKVRKEIEMRTVELAGNKKNITDEAIVLTVYSKLLYNLSFVDLPGLTKVPVGDQPDDIEEKIRNVVLQFIKNPNSIILAVVTANTDPATSESLHIAKSVDPNGERTLAVVTKIDIMDAGTDAAELLSGEVIPVKLGIIGVVNRSQKDINEQKSIEHSMSAETQYLQKVYPKIADQHGTINLGKKLQSLLIHKIKDTCPALKKQLFDMHTQCSGQLRLLKEFTNNYDRSLLDLLTQTATSYRARLDGQSTSISLTELNSGAKISRHFQFSFNKDIDEIDPLYGLSDDAIINAINNASGISMGVFMPADAFDHIVKKQLRQLEGPSLSCVEFVYEELMSSIYHLDEDITHELKKYPRLMDKINEVLSMLLDKYKQKSLKAVSKMINYQIAFINTVHPDFIQAVMKSKECKELLLQSVKKENKGFVEIEQKPPNDDGSYRATPNTKFVQKLSNDVTPTMQHVVEKITTCAFSTFADPDKLIMKSRAKLLSLFIQCYFKVIKKIIQDCIPKTIMFEMVNSIKDNFPKELISRVYKTNDLKMTELLLESPEIVDERFKAQNRFDAADKALKLMRDIEKLCNFGTDK